MGIIDSITFRTRRKYQAVRKWVRRQLATVNEAPLFVLGNQKSGTTAIAVLLAKRTGQSVTWDLATSHSGLLTAIHDGRMPIDALIDEEVLAFSRDVIKDPDLTLLYDALSDRFPAAQFVMIIRDPRDNIRSILDRLGLPGRPEQHTHDGYEELPEGWKRVLNGNRLDMDESTYIDRLAERWRIMARVYLENKGNLELIRYEDFLSDKVAAIDDLAHRLGLPRKASIEDQVDQQFQPRGKRRNMDWLSVYGERNLERIEKRCRAPMRELGYDDFRVASV
jgi:hypothetical protein